jgi:Domain of unknown function (DUF4192)
MSTTLTARVPEDLLAAVPVVLGFRPADSLVMLTFGGRQSFHARVDLPGPHDPARSVRELARSLLEPALEQGVERVVFVAYTSQPRLAARLARCLVQVFTRAEVAVIDVLRAHDGRWVSVPCRPQQREGPPRPYDDRAHPFAAQAVFDGRVTHATRDGLRAGLAPDPALRHRTAEAERALRAPEPGELRWALHLVRRCVGESHVPSDAEAARLLRAVTEVEVRDAALFAVCDHDAVQHLALWSAMLRRASDAQVPDTAALAAFCAWRSGHGALAWCALDRCFEIDPDHVLGLALAECLVRAVPPSRWEERGPVGPAERDATSGASGVARSIASRTDRPDGEFDTA